MNIKTQPITIEGWRKTKRSKKKKENPIKGFCHNCILQWRGHVCGPVLPSSLHQLFLLGCHSPSCYKCPSSSRSRPCGYWKYEAEVLYWIPDHIRTGDTQPESFSKTDFKYMRGQVYSLRINKVCKDIPNITWILFIQIFIECILRARDCSRRWGYRIEQNRLITITGLWSVHF